MNINNIKPNDMDNVITTPNKETYADPRNKSQGKSQDWYDGFQHGYSDGYEKGYDEGYDKGWEEGIHVEQERDYF